MLKKTSITLKQATGLSSAGSKFFTDTLPALYKNKMIDLSFLTEEEQEAIMKVLQRDAELKRTEEERVR